MADIQKIQFKRSKTPGSRPNPADVAEGEILLNLADRAILTKMDNEIIDLGFAKGGNVDGNINQTSGNFTTTGDIVTTGAIRINGRKVIINGPDNTPNSRPQVILDSVSDRWRVEPDGTGMLQLSHEGTQTNWEFGKVSGNQRVASQQWTNTMIKDLGNGVGMASPRATTEIANNDDGNMGFWDKTTKRWVFVVHPNAGPTLMTNTGLIIRNEIPTGNQDQTKLELVSPDKKKAIGLYTYNDGRNLLSAKNDNGSWTNIQISDVGFDVPVSLRLTGGDYAGIQMMRSDGTYSRIEQNPMSSSYLFTFIGRTATGQNQHVVSLPRESGIIATREWVQNNMGGLATINAVYPIGIVMWFAQNKNPNTLFPGTTWKYIGENKTVRLANASGNNVMQAGGSDSVSLSAGHMPSHTHSFSATTSSFDYGTKTAGSAGAHTHSIPVGVSHNNNMRTVCINNTNSPKPVSINGLQTIQSNTLLTESGGAHTHSVGIGAHSHSVSGTTAATGSGSAFSVVNSYIMLMAWYRVS